MTSVSGATASAPVTGTYTSPVINAGVATTTWKTLSHTRVLQQTSPASFGARATVATGLSSVNEINAADFNRDGAVDVVVASPTGGSKDLFIYQSNGGNPTPTFTQIKVTDDGVAP